MLEFRCLTDSEHRLVFPVKRNTCGIEFFASILLFLGHRKTKTLYFSCGKAYAVIPGKMKLVLQEVFEL